MPPALVVEEVFHCCPHRVKAKRGPGARSAIDDLVSLAELHGRGILTDEEFAAKKKRILGI